MSGSTKMEKHVRIEIEGDLLGLSALSLQERLPVGDLSHATQVRVSMANVRHMDQAGLAILVRLYSHLRVRGGDLVLLDVQLPVLKTLERIGLGGLVSHDERLKQDVQAPRQAQHESAIQDVQPEL